MYNNFEISLQIMLLPILIGQFNRTVRAITRALQWVFFFSIASKKKILRISCVLILKRALCITKFEKVMINW